MAPADFTFAPSPITNPRTVNMVYMAGHPDFEPIIECDYDEELGKIIAGCPALIERIDKCIATGKGDRHIRDKLAAAKKELPIYLANAHKYKEHPDRCPKHEASYVILEWNSVQGETNKWCSKCEAEK